MTLFDVGSALDAVESGTVDVTFRVVARPDGGTRSPGRLPDGLRAMRVLDEPHQLLTGPGHEFARATQRAAASPYREAVSWQRTRRAFAASGPSGERRDGAFG